MRRQIHIFALGKGLKGPHGWVAPTKIILIHNQKSPVVNFNTKTGTNFDKL